MKIKSVRLENIRSYKDALIELPEGSVLLAGDIGSGKTTILLAIDFALFGVRRGELSGSALLRHGEDYGSVEVIMELNGKSVKIYRSLRRKDETVTQDEGFIEINGDHEDLSTVEMQSRIMDMLNYPVEFVKKNKSLIYKYTVYTQQESMKQILQTDEDERLTILRKIFDIDKYKTISQNAEEIARQLRADYREIASSFSDLDKKKEELAAKEKISIDIRQTLDEVNERLKESRNALNEKRKEKDSVVKAAEEMNAVKQRISYLAADMNAKKLRKARIEKEMEQLLKEKTTLPAMSDIEKLAAKKPKFTLDEVDAEKKRVESDKEAALNERSTTMADLERWKRILAKGTCATCGQRVNDPTSFKNRIMGVEMTMQGIDGRLREKAEMLEKLAKIRDSIYAYTQEEQRKRNLMEQVIRIDKNISALGEEKKTIEIDVSAAEKELAEKKNMIDETISQKLAIIEKELDELNGSNVMIEKEHGRIEQQLHDYEELITELKKEISDKEERKKTIQEFVVKEGWLTNLFVPLMTTIEKHVMVQIHKEFNALFKKWFGMLIDNEQMSARIDDEFGVIIEQNGYETEYCNLSGGERTSVALAYRLALNAVINKIVEHIRTKDLLILDEPTDGFSTDQLEKVRDVLNELNLGQIIIVSHEPKIETFVDKVIRFSKEGGITQIR